MAAKVIGVAYGGGHANIVIPVLRTLAERGIDTCFLALTSAGPQARQAGLEYRSFRDYRHLVDAAKAAGLGQKLAADMHNPGIGISLEESVYYLGINLLENIQTLGEDLAMRAIELGGRHSFLAVDFLQKIIEAEKCTHVLTTNSPRSEKASLIAAQQMDLKSFRIDDLYGVPVLYDSLMRKMGPELYYQTTGRFRITPTQSCFLCDFARDHFISRQDKWDMVGVDHANSTVTGQPVFDAIDEVMRRRPDMGLFPERPSMPVVTWAHENGHVDEPEVVALLAQWFADHGSDINLVIKVRPNIEPQEISDILGLFDAAGGNLRVVHTEIDPNVVIWNSQLVLGQVSTMLTQAAYMGRPMVILDPSGLRGDEPLVRANVAQAVGDAQQLQAAIESLGRVDSEMRQAFTRGCRRMNFKHDGTKNVCDLIEGYL